MKYRVEKDTMGTVEVAAEKLWGAQTQRSLENFPIGPPASMPAEIIRAFGYLKKAAAATNRDLGVLAREKSKVIAEVCDEIVEGKLDDHFPLVIWQTGSGTQTNMNVNEVIANRAHQLLGFSLDEGTRVIHPNDDVNRSQSSNDTFPTAMHIAAAKMVVENTIPAIGALRMGLEEKSLEFKDIIKIGRTHWMDATPLTLGQEFSGYAAMVAAGEKALLRSEEGLLALALGGTAVGTGINCPSGYDVKVAEYIAEYTGLPFYTAENKFASLAGHEAIVESHGALKQLAVSLIKITNDIRCLASGPRAGIGELRLPANEPGSSIMPGKVNPTQVEALSMVCTQIIGNDTAVAFGSSSGHFELNVYKPLIISNFLQSAQLLGDGCRSFEKRCLRDIEADFQVIEDHVERSLMLVTALTPHIGYDKAAEIAKAAHRNGTTLKEEIMNTLDVTSDQVDEWLRPDAMI